MTRRALAPRPAPIDPDLAPLIEALAKMSARRQLAREAAEAAPKGS